MTTANSREILELATRMAKVGGWTLDIGTQELSWSDEVSRIHELPIGETPPLEDAIQFYTEPYRPIIAEAVREGMESGTPWDLELQLRTAKGRLVWVRALGEAIMEDGECQRLIGTFQDITNQRESQKQLLLTQASVDHSSDAVFHVRPDATFSYANEAACQLLGYSQSEILQLRVFDITPDIDPQQWTSYYDTIREARSQHQITRQRRKDGSIIEPVEVHKTFLESGDEEFVVVNLRDRSLEKRAEDLRDILFQSSNDAHLLFAEDGIVECNQAAIDMLRMESKEELLAQHPAVFSPEFQPDGQRSMDKYVEMDRLAAENGFHRFDWLHKRRGGEVFPCEVSQTKVELASGQAMLTVWHDISERIENERLIRESQEQLNLALMNSNVGLWDWDVATNTVYFSDTYKTQLGYEADEDWSAGYSKWKELLHPEDTEAATKRIEDYLAGTDPIYQSRFRLRAANGEYRWIQAQGKAECDKNGRPVRVVGVHIDFTQVAEKEQQLNSLNRALARSNEALGEFAYTASHDLQSPLRTIAGFASFIKEDYDDKLDDKGRHYIERMIGGVGRMHRVIKDLLDYARVESQAEPFKKICVKEVVHGVIDLLNASISESKAAITTEDLPTLPADSTQLTRVFLNLVGNAIKYRRPEVPPQIRITHSRVANQFRFVVEDNGIGIAERNLSSVFDLFRRLHTENDYPGTGIGLAITRRIITRHGGNVGVESKIGEGSRFWFTLPVEQNADNSETDQFKTSRSLENAMPEAPGTDRV